MLIHSLPKPPDLAHLQWHKRVVIVFASDAEDDKYRQQMQTLQEGEREVNERDIEIFGVVGNAGEVDAFRRKLGCPEHGFAVVLLGKDGGVKLRSERPLPDRKLFETIDRMPMRQQEMRSRN